MIVEAVGIAISHANVGQQPSEEIAEAMRQALIKAQAEGITDPDLLRARMQEAREI